MPDEKHVVQKKIIIKNKSGLHARPAALFVQIANKFNSDVTVSKGSKKVNGKSIMGILMLAAGKGSSISIRVEGNDAQDAMIDLEKVLSGEIDDTKTVM